MGPVNQVQWVGAVTRLIHSANQKKCLLRRVTQPLAACWAVGEVKHFRFRPKDKLNRNRDEVLSFLNVDIGGVV